MYCEFYVIKERRENYFREKIKNITKELSLNTFGADSFMIQHEKRYPKMEDFQVHHFLEHHGKEL